MGLLERHLATVSWVVIVLVAISAGSARAQGVAAPESRSTGQVFSTFPERTHPLWKDVRGESAFLVVYAIDQRQHLLWLASRNATPAGAKTPWVVVDTITLDNLFLAFGAGCDPDSTHPAHIALFDEVSKREVRAWRVDEVEKKLVELHPAEGSCRALPD